jgi:hypothetical protein
VAIASLLAHGALVTLLLRAPISATPPGPDVGPIMVSLYDGSALAAEPKPPDKAVASPLARTVKAEVKPPQPTEVQPQYIDVVPSDPELGVRGPLQDPVALSIAAAANGASGQACQLTQWLQQALQADPQVHAALLTIPRPARSLSNALMLWDGRWIDSQPRAASGVAMIRTAVISGIRAAPEACQTQLVRGPELMTLTSGVDTTVVAIGSGEWRWGDLLDDKLTLTLVHGLVRPR